MVLRDDTPISSALKITNFNAILPAKRTIFCYAIVTSRSTYERVFIQAFVLTF